MEENRAQNTNTNSNDPTSIVNCSSLSGATAFGSGGAALLQQFPHLADFLQKAAAAQDLQAQPPQQQQLQQLVEQRRGATAEVEHLKGTALAVARQLTEHLSQGVGSSTFGNVATDSLLGKGERLSGIPGMGPGRACRNPFGSGESGVSELWTQDSLPWSNGQAQQGLPETQQGLNLLLRSLSGRYGLPEAGAGASRYGLPESGASRFSLEAPLLMRSSGEGESQPAPPVLALHATGSGTGTMAVAPADDEKGQKRPGEGSSDESDWEPRVHRKKQRKGESLGSGAEDSGDCGGGGERIKAKSMTERQRRDRIRDALKRLRTVVNAHGDMASMLNHAVDVITQQQKRLQELEMVMLQQQLRQRIASGSRGLLDNL